MYEYEDDDDGRSLTRIILCGVAVVVLSALLWFVIRPSLGGGGTTSASIIDAAADTVVEDQAAEDQAVDATSTSALSPTTTRARRSDHDGCRRATTTTTTVAAAPADTAVATDTPTDSSLALDESQEQVEQVASYPTLPDGSPVPVLAIFDTDTITLSGTVPSQAAAERLAQLAIANSKTPAALVQFLAINPDVPTNVGVRVIEMNSSRFPDGSADVLPDHGQELDRIGAVMNALPNTTVLVIGHADQRGSEAANFAVSEARARAVVSHLVDYGIDAARLSSRAVGENDLLSLNDDDDGPRAQPPDRVRDLRHPARHLIAVVVVTGEGGVRRVDDLTRDGWSGRGAVTERPATERFPAVWCDPPRQVGAERHDPGRVDVGVNLVVVAFDVDEVDRVAEAGGLEQVAGIGPQHRHLGQLLAVALEVAVIHGVEPDQGREQADVGLGDRVADQVALVRRVDRSASRADRTAADRHGRTNVGSRRTRSGRRRC